MGDRTTHSCNDFKNSGSRLAVVEAPICENCGWVDSTHHAWEKQPLVGSLGPGWSCRRCGRSAYTKDGRCSDDEPPTDYPPCSTWSSDW